MIRGLVAALAVIAALVALSWAVIAADRAAMRADTVRLALWRLDAEANAVILTETARPVNEWPRPLATPPILSRDVLRREGQQQQYLAKAPADKALDASSADEPPRAAAPAPTILQATEAQAAGSSGSFDYAKRLRNSAQVQSVNANRATAPIQVGAPTLRWEENHLLLERPLPDGARAQTVIDWTRWRTDLLHEIADLLPAAQLRPALESDLDRLASIPATLESGPLNAPLATATIWMITGAWLAGLGGLAAVLLAMAAAARLAERRAAFVSAVTHELRTPLTALRLHGDLLADARIADDPARRAAPVNAIREGATRLAHLIDNVLDYARLERRRPPAPRTVHLDALLTDLDALLPGVIIPPIPAVMVRADPQAVERILANLADNARKYGKPPYTLTIVATARRVTLTLIDHGPGLAADARARLFTPFARSAEAAAGDAPGVGLGLALCRRLARAQNGDLHLEVVSGGGVAAVLTLKRA